MVIRDFVFAAMAGGFALGAHAQSATPNEVQGTWGLVSATINPEGAKQPAYGENPKGILSFTSDMHFVVVLTDGAAPRFVSNVRGEGTDAENRNAMASSIGFFGTYSVDGSGEFSGNRVEGSTFPNWVGSVRTRKDLRMVVSGDQMTEDFQRPDGAKIRIVWQRLK